MTRHIGTSAMPMIASCACRSSSGSLVAATLRASSLVSNSTAERPFDRNRYFAWRHTPARDDWHGDLAEGLKRIACNTEAFIAVSNGPEDILYLEGDAVRRLPVFSITAVDTIGAGDAFHGGFVLALAEGQSEVEAMRFGAAVAGIKCTRLGGSAGTPRRSEVEALIAENRLPAAAQ